MAKLEKTLEKALGSLRRQRNELEAMKVSNASATMIKKKTTQLKKAEKDLNKALEYKD